MADKLRKYKSLYSSTCNTFSTGEGVTITPASVTGLPTDTEITLTFDRVDSSGTKTPSKMERIRGTITGGNFVISSGGRAVEGTEQVHTSPVVEMIWNADDWNDTVDHILTEHNQDGTHKDTLVTSLKATGAVVNTGTSDVTIVTPKAIADSKVSITDKVETLTNKTLTSPLFNGNVDGWVSANETWTYASASSFTISGVDVTSKYPLGTKLRFKQGAGYKYAVVASSAFSTNTTVTIFVNTDYTIANDTITDNGYSYQERPQGYPDWFNFTPTYTNLTVGSGTNSGRYKVQGKVLFFRLRFKMAADSSVAASVITWSNLPGTKLPDYDALSQIGYGTAHDSDGSSYRILMASAGYLFTDYIGGVYSNVLNTNPFTWTTNDIFHVQGFYYLA